MGLALGLAVVLAVAAGRWLPRPAAARVADGDRPHVVLIVLDTLRADRLGCYGGPPGVSPELDRLAREGVRFDRAIAQSPWTRPSVGSFLTSQYPRTLGIHVEKWDPLGSRFPTLPEVLRAQGYRTLGATANPNINSSFGFDRGFDVHFDSNVVWEWMGPDAKQQAYEEGHLPLARDRMSLLLEAMDAETPADRRKPHYLQLNVMEVHEAFKNKPILRAEHRHAFEGRRDAPYLRTIRQVSQDVGWFMERLARRPGWDDVVYVILSDHGEGLHDHPHVANSFWHGHLLYESNLRVPFMMHATSRGRLPEGRVVRRPVRLLDTMPTLLEVLSIEAPPGIVGHSLRPVLEDPAAPLPLPDRFAVETRFRGADKIGFYGRDWKYFEHRDGHRGTAPKELQPVGAGEDGARTSVAREHPERVRELARELRAWERDHPMGEPAVRDQEVSADEVEQLRSLGYVR
ncbi:MAG: sulfatase [Myxococcota bacterium]